MGKRIRRASPRYPSASRSTSLPKDHFYRRLEARLDLSFVRELVAPLYANGGRLFFEHVRSERQLMAAVADRLSLRWYQGYDLDEPWHRRLLPYGLRRPPTLW